MTERQVVSKIKIERPSNQRLEALKISSWPIWTKERSSFAWHYDEPETCFFIEGDVVVKTDEGELSIGQGDLVTFPKGLDCTWQVKEAVRKHYKFG